MGRKDQVIDQEKAEIVRRIFRYALAGMSTHAIADLLNGEGIPAPKGGKWRGMTVHVILTNARYAGWIIYNRFTRRKNANGVSKDVENPADRWVVAYRADLAIVDAETFARVAEVLKSRAPAEAKRFEQSKYALSRRMECHACGSVMQIRISNGYRFAACGKRLDHKSCSNGEMIGLGRIEGAVLTAVIGQLEGPALQAVADGNNAERRRREDVTGNRRAGLARVVDDMERKLRASLDAGYSAGISPDVVVAQRTEWSERRAEALRELAEIDAQCEPVVLDAERVEGLLSRLKSIVPGTPFRPDDLEGRELVAIFQPVVCVSVQEPRVHALASQLAARPAWCRSSVMGSSNRKKAIAKPT